MSQLSLIALAALLIACQSKVEAQSSRVSGKTLDEPTRSKSSLSDCIDPDLTMVANTQKLTLCDGTLASGTLAVSPACEADGQEGCVTTTTFKAAKMANFSDGDVRAGITIAGVTGVLSNAPNSCTTDGATGCLAVAAYPAVDTNKLTPAVLKKDSIVAGVTGAYPSVAHPLAVSDAADDLDAATFDAKIKNGADMFGWFDRNGVRYALSGDGDIDSDNIKDGVSIFGTVGNVETLTNADAWHLRSGVTVAGIAGKLKTNCRNGGNLAIVDIGMPMTAIVDSGTDVITTPIAHGFETETQIRIISVTNPGGLNGITSYYAIKLSATTFKVATSIVNAQNGVAIDITSNGADIGVLTYLDGTLGYADTLDDYNGDGMAPINAHPWNSNRYLCGGLEATAGDDNVWKDVTTGGCDGVKCRYLDKISGLEWSKAAASEMVWGAALDHCHRLALDGGGWRLPTLKELMDASVHGAWSVAAANWISPTIMNDILWSATNDSNGIGNAWWVRLSEGDTGVNNKSLAVNYVACVR